MDIEYKHFYEYDVYNDGRIYSNLRNKFLKPSIVHGYAQYALSINHERKVFKAHRLVAELFVNNPKPDEYKIINHKDGNKLNNFYTNLEWCDYYINNKHARDTNLNNVKRSNSVRWEDEEFRLKTSKHISEGMKKAGISKGKNNPKFRYLIFDKNQKEIDRIELSLMCGLSLSYTDALIKKFACGKHNKYFDERGIKIIDTKEGQSTIENIA